MKLQPGFKVPNMLTLAAVADYGCDVSSLVSLQALRTRCRADNVPLRVVGAGSNIVAAPQVAGCVAVMKIPGVKLLDESERWVHIEVGAGENWHQLVMQCLQAGWNGLENLALIPGTVGAAPIQNIGAYGVEIADFITGVAVVDDMSRHRLMTSQECGFTYRASVFKAEPELVITAVRLRLHKTAEVNVTYPDVQAWLAERGMERPSPRAVADAVIDIRSNKLPDPQHIPNVGSFFKNPVLGVEQASRLTAAFSQLKSFPAGQESSAEVKFSAAQLIDLAGCKQLTDGPVTCWPRQPLVLINNGRGSYADVVSFADRVAARVLTKFGVQLELEPSLLS